MTAPMSDTMAAFIENASSRRTMLAAIRKGRNGLCPERTLAMTSKSPIMKPAATAAITVSVSIRPTTPSPNCVFFMAGPPGPKDPPPWGAYGMPRFARPTVQNQPFASFQGQTPDKLAWSRLCSLGDPIEPKGSTRETCHEKARCHHRRPGVSPVCFGGERAAPDKRDRRVNGPQLLDAGE